MKKKFSIWLNIVTVCLCFAAIAIGVYAATSATLTISGSIGFEAHGIEMTISGNLSGYVSKANIDKATETESKSVSASLTTAKTTDLMDLGEVYFTDLVLDDEGKIPNIVLTLNFTNTSPFKVKATISASTLLSNNDIEVTEDNQEVVMNATNGTGSVEIRFKLKDESSGNDITALNLANKTIIVFEKVNEPKEGELYIDDGKLFVNYGYYPETEETVEIYLKEGTNQLSSNNKMFGENLGKPIRWVAIYDVNAKTSNGLNTLTSVPKSGSYYFISEYAFDKKAFNTNITTPTNSKNPNDYAVSNIRDYIIEDGQFQQKYKLDKLYDDVTERSLPKEFAMYTMSGTNYPNGKYTIENCTDKLWLISRSETDYVDNVIGGRCIAYYPSQTDQVYNENPTEYGVFWWTRSPSSSDTQGKEGIAVSLGNPAFMAVTSNVYAIRPMFQLDF